jgi:D-3-phosphoglycerate dehydrogenase
MNPISDVILIIDDVHASLVEGLDSAGAQVYYRPEIKADEILPTCLDLAVTGLVVRSKFRLTSLFFDQVAGVLQWVARAGAGLDNIDLKSAEEHGIYCFNAGEANSVAVGEQTVGMLLSLLHNLGKGNSEVRCGIWDREGNRGWELGSMVVGVLGYGNTGEAVAKRLRAFGCQIIAVDKYKNGFAKPWNLAEAELNRSEGKGAIFEGGLDDLYGYSDVLTLHVPLTSETKFFVDEGCLDRFCKSFWLLNLSRGEVVKTLSVVQGLASGKILGFGADVLEIEPPFQKMPEFDALVKFSNVIFSPHVGGWTRESYQKISKVLLAKVLDYYRVKRA